MKLIENWQSAWKMWSVRILAALAIVATSWAAVPDSVKSLIPEQYLGYIVGFVSVCAAIARIIKQFSLDSNSSGTDTGQQQ
ncbi:DUF7940 domain-containing protein [Raoultella ornithinolytica]|uniref:Holin n=1 Tax=Raoultella ornithinolytica TaxID=54291 RepID=A0A9Q9MZN8_RAOOR|nr:hypothetical protein [Raoultella ornithinolytica]UXE39611.1 hypothetical protein N2J37_07695 [Raoultella ornithinolytica]